MIVTMQDLINKTTAYPARAQIKIEIRGPGTDDVVVVDLHDVDYDGNFVILSGVTS